MLPALIVACFTVTVYRAAVTAYVVRSGLRLRTSWLECTWPLVAAAWYVADGALLAGHNGWHAAFLTIIIPSAFAGTLGIATTAMLLDARRVVRGDEC